MQTTISREVGNIRKETSNLSHQSTKIETSVRSLNDIKNDIKKSIEEVSSVGVRDIKDVVEKNSSQVSSIDASVPQPVEISVSDDEWDNADSGIPDDADVQGHHKQTMPEEPNTRAVGNDAAKVEPENELTDNEPDKNEKLANSQTTGTTKSSEVSIVQEENINTVELNEANNEFRNTIIADDEKIKNTHEIRINKLGNSIEGDPVPKKSRKFWWPFPKR